MEGSAAALDLTEGFAAGEMIGREEFVHRELDMAEDLTGIVLAAAATGALLVGHAVVIDRHEKLGQGCIGLEALRRVVCHPALSGRPFILETPNERDGYIREIRMVKEWQSA